MPQSQAWATLPHHFILGCGADRRTFCPDFRANNRRRRWRSWWDRRVYRFIFIWTRVVARWSTCWKTQAGWRAGTARFAFERRTAFHQTPAEYPTRKTRGGGLSETKKAPGKDKTPHRKLVISSFESVGCGARERTWLRLILRSLPAPVTAVCGRCTDAQVKRGSPRRRRHVLELLTSTKLQAPRAVILRVIKLFLDRWHGRCTTVWLNGKRLRMRGLAQ